MKKIICFINNLGSGGAEHQMVELANGLVEKGYDVTITTFGDVDDHYLCKSSIKRHRISPQKSTFHKTLGLIRYFMTVKTDWIISFCQRQNLIVLIIMIFRLWNKPHIISGERNTTIGSPDIYEKILMGILYKKTDYIVPNSYAQYRYIIKKYKRYANKTITITNYTNINLYNQSKLPGDEIIKIVVFGRYSPQKNCMRFVKVVNKLKFLSTKRFVVEWFGNQRIKNSYNPYYKEMKDKIEELELDDCLILNDHTKNVVGEMKRFDAFCLPSLYEGFSNALGEAISCGRPCLVSNIADNALMVSNEENGFLFNPENELEIIDSFLHFFSLSPSERQQMGELSRRKAEILFNREKFIQKYIDLIESKV